jgi:hypothetical protein
MARSKKHHGHRGQLTVPLAVVAGFLPLVSRASQGYRTLGTHGLMLYMTNDLTGYNLDVRQWNFSELLKGWSPIIAGIAAHKVANALGVNRMLGRAKIPLVRI